MTLTDHDYMAEALALARQAGSLGEVPVGALVVREGVIDLQQHAAFAPLYIRKRANDPNRNDPGATTPVVVQQ